MASAEKRTTESSTLSDQANQSLTNQQGAENMAENQNLHSEVNKLKADINRIRGDMRSFYETAKGEGRARAQRAQGDVNAQFESKYEQVQDYIEKQPVKAILIAFGVGMVLAKLFGR